jgi:hypothetical protein
MCCNKINQSSLLLAVQVSKEGMQQKLLLVGRNAWSNKYSTTSTHALSPSRHAKSPERFVWRVCGTKRRSASRRPRTRCTLRGQRLGKATVRRSFDSNNKRDRKMLLTHSLGDYWGATPSQPCSLGQPRSRDGRPTKTNGTPSWVLKKPNNPHRRTNDLGGCS